MIAALWQSLDGDARFTLLTRAANETMRPVHDRMPACLDADGAHAWLDGAPLPAPPEPAFVMRRVGEHVNRIEATGPACLAPPSQPHTPDLFDP